jgi:myo-inositol-1(or 4)-monophosphatase
MTEREFLQHFFESNAAYIMSKYEDRARLAVASKSEPTDFLTEVDLTLQTRFIQDLHEHFPSDAVLAEEADLNNPSALEHERCWILDPLDGTSNYVRGYFPFFAVSVALAVRGLPVLGALFIPAKRHVLFATQELGTAECNGAPIRVSDVARMEEARIELDFGRRQEREAVLRPLTPLLLHAGQVRAQGSAATALAAVACGEADAYVHTGLNPWDFAAGWVIVEAAGGKASRLDGTPLRLNDGKRGVIISNGILHESIVRLIRC